MVEEVLQNEKSSSEPKTKFDAITKAYRKVKYMDVSRAKILRGILQDCDATDVLEIGFYRGKSSLYIGAMMEDRGRGALLTIDRRSAESLSPNIRDLVAEAGLGHRIEPVFSYRSFTWELQKLVSDGRGPRFDLCYFDGGHAWDETGFGFTLVNLLLRPGATIVFDDIDWSMQNSTYHKRHPETMKPYSPDERAARTVRMVWDTLVPAFGYEKVREIPEVGWAVARKPG